MQHKEIRINGQKIAYYESPGPSTLRMGAPAVVMVHGNSMSGLSFQKQLESPLGKKYRLIAIDLPGHGMSDKAPEPEKAYTLPAYAETLVSFVDQLGLQETVFVGLSLGGHILLEAADRLQASGLIISGAPPVSSAAQFQEAYLPNPALSALFNPELSDKEVSAWVAALFRLEADIPDFLEADIRRSDRRARAGLGASVINGDFKNEVEVAAALNVPLAIIHGEKDQITNPDYIKKLHIPTLCRNKIQIIPDAGHTPQWEQPAAFNRLFGEFLEDVRR